MTLLVLGLIAILSAGCSESARRSPTAPTATPTATAAAPPAFVPNAAPPFPAVSQPARVYVAATESAYADFHGGTLKSRYLLHHEGSFALQYASPRFGNFEYHGTYTEANGDVLLYFGDSSIAGAWGATATITEESLTVTYNLLMQHSDFENGVYVRVRD